MQKWENSTNTNINNTTRNAHITHSASTGSTVNTNNKTYTTFIPNIPNRSLNIEVAEDNTIIIKIEPMKCENLNISIRKLKKAIIGVIGLRATNDTMTNRAKHNKGNKTQAQELPQTQIT